MDKKTFIIFITIVIIISALLGFFSYTQQEKFSPEEVTKQYYTLLNEYNLKQAKKLMDNETKKETEDDFYFRWIDIVTKRGMLKDIEITESRIYDTTAIIKLKLIYTDGKSLQIKQQLKNNGKWKLSSTGESVDSLEFMNQSIEVPE